MQAVQVILSDIYLSTLPSLSTVTPATTKDSPKSPEELVTSYSRTKKQPLYRLYYDLHKKYDQV